MAITHATATRNAIADAVDDQVNSGSGTAKLRLRDGTTTIVDFDLSNPAFGNASDGDIDLNGTPISGTAAATGVVDGFQLLDRDGGVVLSGTVTATSGGGDIEVTNTNVASGQDCSLTSLTYSAPD